MSSSSLFDQGGPTMFPALVFRHTFMSTFIYLLHLFTLGVFIVTGVHVH